MIATSIRAASRFEKFRGVRKTGDRRVPRTIRPEQDDEQQRLPAHERTGDPQARPGEPAVAVIGAGSRRSGAGCGGR